MKQQLIKTNNLSDYIQFDSDDSYDPYLSEDDDAVIEEWKKEEKRNPMFKYK